MDAYDIAGERLKKLRESKGFTQEQLSAELNGLISSRQISSWETTGRDGKPARSRRNISIEYLIIIAKYFGVTIDYLLGLTDTPSPSKRVPAGLFDLSAETAASSFPHDSRSQGVLDSLFLGIAHSIKHLEEKTGSGFVDYSSAIKYYGFCTALLESIALSIGNRKEQTTLIKLLDSFREYIGDQLSSKIKDDALISRIKGKADISDVEHDVWTLCEQARNID